MFVARMHILSAKSIMIVSEHGESPLKKCWDFTEADLTIFYMDKILCEKMQAFFQLQPANLIRKMVMKSWSGGYPTFRQSHVGGKAIKSGFIRSNQPLN